MQKIIQDQLDILNNRIKFFGKTRIQDHLQALDKIGEFGTPYDAQYVVQYIHSNKKIVAQKAAEITRKLLITEESRKAWLSLHKSFSNCYYESFNNKTCNKINSFTPEEAAHLYGIASFNHDGYVREAAIDNLQNLSTHEVLPYIILRLNDWVPQVQAKAREVLAKILPLISVLDLIKYYSLIEWLAKTKRVQLLDIQNQLFTQIRNPRNRNDLLAAIGKFPYKERLFCWKVLITPTTYDNVLIDKALADPAPEIRQCAAQHLPELKHFKDRLNTLIADNAARVRYTALKAIPYDDFIEFKKLFDSAIFDDSKPIREYARFILRSHGDKNHVNKYRKRLAKLGKKSNFGTVAGLIETATQEDIPLIKEFIDHKSSKIRACVLMGLNHLGDRDTDHLYIAGIQDSSARVRNNCVTILESGHGYLRPELENLLKEDNVKLQKSVLKILTQYGELESLRDILFALTTPHQDLHKLAWQYLYSWHRHYAERLWFSFNDDVYEQTVELLGQLNKMNLDPPYRAYYIWKDLPNIMKTLKK